MKINNLKKKEKESNNSNNNREEEEEEIKISFDSNNKLHCLKRRIHNENESIRNHLLSIKLNSEWVKEASEILSGYALIANLRNGEWYFHNWNSFCYFKSGDGHDNEWTFSLSRLNLNVVKLASKFGGCLIVDSTRRGKIYPDSLTATIPIWCAVINKLLFDNKSPGFISPPWMPTSRCSIISDLIPVIIENMPITCRNYIIKTLKDILYAPLHPFWVSPIEGMLQWEGEGIEDLIDNIYTTIPENQRKFIPITLLSCSDDISLGEHNSVHSWYYIKGAGDDDENWSHGLTPSLFWKNSEKILESNDPMIVENFVKDIVQQEKEFNITMQSYDNHDNSFNNDIYFCDIILQKCQMYVYSLKICFQFFEHLIKYNLNNNHNSNNNNNNVQNSNKQLLSEPPNVNGVILLLTETEYQYYLEKSFDSYSILDSNNLLVNIHIVNNVKVLPLVYKSGKKHHSKNNFLEEIFPKCLYFYKHLLQLQKMESSSLLSPPILWIGRTEAEVNGFDVAIIVCILLCYYNVYHELTCEKITTEINIEYNKLDIHVMAGTVQSEYPKFILSKIFMKELNHFYVTTNSPWKINQNNWKLDINNNNNLQQQQQQQQQQRASIHRLSSIRKAKSWVQSPLRRYSSTPSISNESIKLLNHLKSILYISNFITYSNITKYSLPIIGNEPSGSWYYSKYDSKCNFKNGDGKESHWLFDITSLNLHVASISASASGCIIIDSTNNSEKLFPDSMILTIPIWCSIINSILFNTPIYFESHPSYNESSNFATTEMINNYIKKIPDVVQSHIIFSLRDVVKYPLQPIWLSLKSNNFENNNNNNFEDKNLIWEGRYSSNFLNNSYLNQFIPIILFNCCPIEENIIISTDTSWEYVKGPGNNELKWCRGLTPQLFWNNTEAILSMNNAMTIVQFIDNLVNESLINSQNYFPITRLNGLNIKVCHLKHPLSDFLNLTEINGIIIVSNEVELTIPAFLNSSNLPIHIFSTNTTNITNDINNNEIENIRQEFELNDLIFNVLKYYSDLLDENNNVPPEILICSDEIFNENQYTVILVLILLCGYFNPVTLQVREKEEEFQLEISDLWIMISVVHSFFSRTNISKSLLKQIQTYFLSNNAYWKGRKSLLKENIK